MEVNYTTYGIRNSNNNTYGNEMAEILDQKAIDDLLNEAIEIDDEENEQSAIETDKFEGRKSGVSFKPVIREKKIIAPYVSPVLKSEKILYNPQIEEVEEMHIEIPVVRSIKNYNQKNGKNNRRRYIS